MPKINFNKLKGTLQEAAGTAAVAVKNAAGTASSSVKNAAETVKEKAANRNKQEEGPSSRSDRVKEAFEKNKETSDAKKTMVAKNVSAENALKIVYYLMSVDGKILKEEEEKFDSIFTELDSSSALDKNAIVEECKAYLENSMDDADFYDLVQDGVENAIYSPDNTANSSVLPKLLLWNLLTVAFSDGEYDESERRLIKYFVRKYEIEKAAFLEMENSILTLMDLEKEKEWIKTTNRQYVEIQNVIDEINVRQEVIIKSVKDLISL